MLPAYTLTPGMGLLPQTKALNCASLGGFPSLVAGETGKPLALPSQQSLAVPRHRVLLFGPELRRAAPRAVGGCGSAQCGTGPGSLSRFLDPEYVQKKRDVVSLCHPAVFVLGFLPC